MPTRLAPNYTGPLATALVVFCSPAGGRVAPALKAPDGRAIVRVSDTGIGLDATDRQQLFERLYRGSPVREMRPTGMGLGLAIAHWIVVSRAGTNRLVNRDDGGTSATVDLPVRAS